MAQRTRDEGGEGQDGPGGGARFSRRDFLELGSGATLALALSSLPGCDGQPSGKAGARGAGAKGAAQPAGAPRGPLPPATAFDRYRREWSWDSVVRGTHNLNCWYQQNCCFHVYSRDGRVVREEQVGDYPQTHSGVPDFNPRGCQKGCTYSELMYSAPRVTRPLRRVGERGEGRFEPVSWDEAFEDIAGRIVDTIASEGPASVVVDQGASGVNQMALASWFRLADVLDATLLDTNCEIGDDQQGGAVTYGEASNERSADDYFYSDLILVWGGNPAYTQIPNFHFLTEARYHGTRIVAISPDFNASAMHTDLWLPVKPGSDAALALSMAQVMVEEGLYDADLIREQTDLPFLVRTDTGKLLRESDLEKGGSDRTLYRYDERSASIRAAEMETLHLGDERPALEGTFRVKTLEGPATVRPVFELLKESLEQYRPERAAEVCGTPPGLIRRLARMLATSRAATNTCTSGISKFHHGGLMMRAMILVYVLAGHLGRKGAGYVTASFLLPDGQGPTLWDMQLFKELRWQLVKGHGWKLLRGVVGDLGWRRAVIEFLGDIFAETRMVSNSTLFYNLHGGLLEVSGQRWDDTLPRDPAEYVREALEKRWQPLDPPPEQTPRVLISGMGNPLRRVRASQRLRETLWPKLDLIVAIDLRMSSTALHADYVLPVAGAYEKTTAIAVNTNPLAPFVHTTRQAVPRVGESRDEWEIVCGIARQVQQQARARGVRTFKSRHGNTRRLDDVHENLTKNGEIGDRDGEKLSQALVEASTNISDVTWEELKHKGYARFSGLGRNPANFGHACDIEPGETISPHTWHTEKKEPWTTLSGRVQFYIDHDWYLELGEALPAHKPSPKAGGDHPLVMTGGHARWSIHATWRSDPLLLRLQRGEPCMWIAVEDAAARGIADGERIRVSNDVGAFVTRAKISPAVRPGQVIMYHAWEDYQFEGGIGYRNVQASPLNPIEMVGDYPFLKPVIAQRQPGQSDRDTRVELERV